MAKGKNKQLAQWGRDLADELDIAIDDVDEFEEEDEEPDTDEDLAEFERLSARCQELEKEFDRIVLPVGVDEVHLRELRELRANAERALQFTRPDEASRHIERLKREIPRVEETTKRDLEREMGALTDPPGMVEKDGHRAELERIRALVRDAVSKKDYPRAKSEIAHLEREIGRVCSTIAKELTRSLQGVEIPLDLEPSELNEITQQRSGVEGLLKSGKNDEARVGLTKLKQTIVDSVERRKKRRAEIQEILESIGDVDPEGADKSESATLDELRKKARAAVTSGTVSEAEEALQLLQDGLEKTRYQIEQRENNPAYVLEQLEKCAFSKEVDKELTSTWYLKAQSCGAKIAGMLRIKLRQLGIIDPPESSKVTEYTLNLKSGTDHAWIRHTFEGVWKNRRADTAHDNTLAVFASDGEFEAALRAIPKAKNRWRYNSKKGRLEVFVGNVGYYAESIGDTLYLQTFFPRSGGVTYSLADVNRMLKTNPCRTARAFWDMMETRVERMNEARRRFANLPPFPEGATQDEATALNDLYAAVDDAIYKDDNVDNAERWLEALLVKIDEVRKQIAERDEK